MSYITPKMDKLITTFKKEFDLEGYKVEHSENIIVLTKGKDYHREYIIIIEEKNKFKITTIARKLSVGPDVYYYKIKDEMEYNNIHYYKDILNIHIALMKTNRSLGEHFAFIFSDNKKIKDEKHYEEYYFKRIFYKVSEEQPNITLDLIKKSISMKEEEEEIKKILNMDL